MATALGEHTNNLFSLECFERLAEQRVVDTGLGRRWIGAAGVFVWHWDAVRVACDGNATGRTKDRTNHGVLEERRLGPETYGATVRDCDGLGARLVSAYMRDVVAECTHLASLCPVSRCGDMTLC